MRKILTLMLTLTLFTLTSSARPKFLSKAKKSVLAINTYDSQGNLLRKGSALLIGADGEAIGDYKTFRDAYKAVATDYSGKQWPVSLILGADDTYSVVRFKVDTKSTPAASVATQPTALHAQTYLLKMDSEKAVVSEGASIADTSSLNGKYMYYGLSKKVSDEYLGSPVYDASGTLIGVVHSTLGEKSYVLDIRFAKDLKIEAITSSSSSLALKNIHIAKALPDNQEEALVYLYFQSRSAGDKEYIDLIDRFVSTYPQCAEGYMRRATPLIDMREYDKANADMEKYLSLVEDKADGHYKVASLIHDKIRLQPDSTYEKWTLDVAASHLDEAIAINAARADGEAKTAEDWKYKVLKAQVMLTKRDYDSAISIYESLNEGEGRPPSIYYSISMAKEMRGDSLALVIEPMDSAIAMFGDPMPREAGQYVIRRGKLKADAGRYREAVSDYNKYCYLENSQVNDLFYYERAVIEENGRMFQQALDDIKKAIELSPRNPSYYLEKAVIEVSVNLLEDCVKTCQTVISLDPSISDTYRILGYAQFQLGDKESAKTNLQKALDMKDEWAQSVMDALFK